MFELVSGIPILNSEKNFVSARIRAGSRFKLILCFVSINARYFRVTPKMSSGTLGGTPG
jgi:hypothetical protein